MMIGVRRTTWTAFKPRVVLVSLVFSLSRHLHVASYSAFTNSNGVEMSRCLKLSFCVSLQSVLHSPFEVSLN